MRCGAPPTRTGVALVAYLLAASLLAACNAEEPEGAHFGPTLTLNPASLSLVVGQSATIGVGLPGGATAQTRVRWVSNAPTIAAVDSAPRVGRTAGDPVPVRGHAVGSTFLTGTVIHQGQTLTASVPVTVRAAP